jgi:hypothetical protein
VHYDYHAMAEDDNLGGELTYEHLRAEMERLKPDWIQCDCKGVFGLTSYPSKLGNAAPGIVRDSLRIYRDVTAELGIPLLVHYCALWDKHAASTHPDWARVGPDGTPSPDFVCTQSPFLTTLMIPQMKEIISDYQVDGFWVDADGILMTPCYCQRCQDNFRQLGNRTVPRSPGQDGWWTWAEFQRRQYMAYMKSYVEAAEAFDPRCQVVVNWLYTMSQPEPFRGEVSHISGDVNDRPLESVFAAEWAALEGRFLDGRGPTWDLIMWSTIKSGSQDIGLTEIKPVAQMCQEAAAVLSCGGAVCVYSSPQRSGHLVSWYQQRVTEVGEFVKARDEVILGTTSIPQVAVLDSAAHMNRARIKDWMFWSEKASDPLRGAVQSLLETHHHLEVLDEERLLDRAASYQVIVVPEQHNLPPETARKLMQYVEDGGRLLVTGCNSADPWPGWLGVQTEAAAGPALPIYAPSGEGGSEATPLAGPLHLVRPDSATALINVLGGNEPEKDVTSWPIATIHKMGAGQVVAVFAPVFDTYWKSRFAGTRSLIASLMAALQADLDLEVEAPASVHCSLRQKDGNTIVHLVNMAPGELTALHNQTWDTIPPARATVSVRTHLIPALVRAVPDQPLDWEWRDGIVVIKDLEVPIHVAIVIEP